MINMEKKFTRDQWINAYDGIAQVISIHEFFVEEYCHEYKKGVPLGQPLRTVVLCKILCDYAGNLRKRSLVQSCNVSLCSLLSEKSRAIIEAIKHSFPEEYNKFDKYKAKQPMRHIISNWLNIPENQVGDIKYAVNHMDVGTLFNYPQVLKYIKDCFPVLDLGAICQGCSRSNNNLVLRLHNDGFVVYEKRAVFTKIKADVK